MKKRSSQKISKTANSLLKYYVLLAAVAFAVYANSLSNDFVFDDESVVLSDPTIKTLSSIPKYITAEAGFHKVIGRYYRPVISSSYALDYAVWKFDPLGYHLTNIIIHIINTLLLFKLLMLIFGLEEKNMHRLYAILLGSVLFAVHPIHTEAVTWISGRTDSLSFTFFAASFVFYILYISAKNKKYLWLLVLFYILALLAKEMAITLPAVIILYDVIVKRYSISELKKKLNVYIILVIISILYLFIRWLILKDVPERVTYYYFYGKDAYTTFLTMLQTVPLYLRLLIVPVGLLYHYSGYFPYVSSMGDLDIIFAVLVIVAILAIALYYIKRLPLITYSILFFFVTILPVMNIVPTMNFMAERFLYIPSVIVSIVLTAFFIKYRSEKNSIAFYSVFAAIIIAFGILTVLRNRDWKDDNTLFLSAEGRPGTVVDVNIGNIYANNREYDKAEVYYRKAIDLRDESLLAWANLGKIFLVKGNFDSAYYCIYKAHLLDTLSPEPMFAMAQLYMNFNKIPEAAEWLEKIQRVTPNYMNSASTLAELRMKMMPAPDSTKKPVQVDRIAFLEQKSFNDYHDRKYSDAIAELNELVRINPVIKYSYYNNLGMCYMEMNKLQDAVKYFELAVESKTDFSTGYNNLGSAYEKMGEVQKAKENYEKAITSDPNNKDAQNSLNRLK
ncbi:MAG: tetratricopeptide repeat protein [Ignavibacteria bacterium]|jgi:tetratricopeptide (TPR) repeat protein